MVPGRYLRRYAHQNRRLRRKALLAPLDNGIDMLRPIVQHTRIDVRAGWPDGGAQVILTNN